MPLCNGTRLVFPACSYGGLFTVHRFFAFVFAIVAATAFDTTLACSYTAHTRLQFAKGTSHLTKEQFAAIVEFMDETYAQWPVLEDFNIAAEAYAPTQRQADALAQRRLDAVAGVVQSFLKDGLRLDLETKGWTEPRSPYGRSNDYVYLMAHPDAAKLKLPPCSQRPLLDSVHQQ